MNAIEKTPMHWSDRATILSVRPWGEGSAIVHVFSANHGLYTGMSRGARGPKQRGVYQPGNIVQADWKARLPEHMGTIACELLEPIAALVLDDRRALSGLRSACVLLETLLSEREPVPELYVRFEMLLHHFKYPEEWLGDYIRLELALLTHAGFGLDLARCAASGESESLCYVSPKTGRAVSREAGEPYRDKLLPLPPFLAEKGGFSSVSAQQIIDGLALTRYFLEKWVFGPRGAPMPAASLRFRQMMEAGSADHQMQRESIG